MNEFKIGDLFCHINRIGEHNPFPPLEYGKTYSTNDKYNPFFSYYQNPFTVKYEKKTNETGRCGPIDLFVNLSHGTLYPDVLPPSYPALADMAYQTACEYIKFSKELLWELVREREFKHRPSRFKCLWLVEDMSQVSSWINQLSAKQFQTVAIELIDIKSIFRADEKIFKMQNEGYHELEKRAREYWDGVDTVSESTEILFEGIYAVKPIRCLSAAPGGNP